METENEKILLKLETSKYMVKLRMFTDQKIKITKIIILPKLVPMK